MTPPSAAVLGEATASTLDALAIRRRLGRNDWRPPKPYGIDGWYFRRNVPDTTIIVSVASHDGAEWIHASISHPDDLPDYADMRRLHHAVFADGFAYEVHAPPASHVNIHEYCRHLWGRLDRRPALPDFGADGSI